MAEDTVDDAAPRSSPPQHDRRIARRRIKHVDYLSSVLEAAGRRDLISEDTQGKTSITYASAHGRQLGPSQRFKQRVDWQPSLGQSAKMSLPRILASHLHHALSFNGDIETTHSSINAEDQLYLESKGYDIDDLQAWAQFILEDDANRAMVLLTKRVDHRGPRAFPLTIIAFFCRRQIIKAHTLRALIDHVDVALGAANEQEAPPPRDFVFMLFVRLVRHARNVLPHSIEELANLLVEHLPKTIPGSTKGLYQTNFMLNRAMSLISLPTSMRPFHDSELQAVALVRLIRHMVEHQPQLHISREGYRAVTRVQLRLEKSSSERVWARLKALSWPPWKQDRTSLDSELGPEHGISAAGKTLIQMKEAGYGMQGWDNVADAYAGWDKDGTPTIQTRHNLSLRTKYYNDEAQIWASRIRVSRTIQEAWACYLTYESRVPALDQDVLLSVFEKLHQAKRLQGRLKKAHESTKVPFETEGEMSPGDAKEISPPPPSIHLHTYTRTEPPEFHTFLTMLEARGVILSDRCGAFLVSHAATLEHGYQYLLHLGHRHPKIDDLLVGRPRGDLVLFSKPLVVATIALLARFPGRGLSHISPISMPVLVQATGLGIPSNLQPCSLDPFNAFIRLVWLVQDSKLHSRHCWHLVFKGLAKTLHGLPIRGTGSNDTCGGQTTSHDSNARDKYRLLAFRFAEQLLGKLQSEYLEVDWPIFTRICVIAKECVAACHRLLEASPAPASGLIDESKLILRQQMHDFLDPLFRHLTAEQSIGDGALATLEANGKPSSQFDAWTTLPALHSYIRLLGSSGAHERLFDLTKWMCAHVKAPAEDDSKRQKLLRGTIVALRVSLDGFLASQNDGFDFHPGSDDTTRNRAAAPDELVDRIWQLLEDTYPSHISGWPSNRTVEEYLERGANTNVR